MRRNAKRNEQFNSQISSAKQYTNKANKPSTGPHQATNKLVAGQQAHPKRRLEAAAIEASQALIAPIPSMQPEPSASNANTLAAHESAFKVLKYLDDYRSSNDTRALREEGYEIDYDRLVGVGANSAVFLAHPINAPPPPLADKNTPRPLYTPGYDIAVKVVAKKWISNKRPSKTRTGNLKLALALGQTKTEHNILKVTDVFKTQDRIFIFMSYCAYGNVISFIRRNGQIPSKLVKKWSAQMAVALSFIHKFHVAHRNYKMENVLIDENLNAKLTGFGLSKFCVDLETKQTIMSHTICGSEPYLAPEMLREASERSYDPKLADVWAFGVGIFLCYTRKYPFEAENLRALKGEQIARRYMEKDVKKRIKGNARELLNSIFSIEPAQRPTMHDLCTKFSWLQTDGRSLPGPPGTPGAPRSPVTRVVKTAKLAQTIPQPRMGPARAEETKVENLNPVIPVSHQPGDPLPANSHAEIGEK